MAEYQRSFGLRTRAILPMVCLALTAACSNSVVEDTSRDIAKRTVNDVVSTRFPGVNSAPYTDCIIDNASTDEILSLAQNALTQNTNAIATMVAEIAQRPDTTTCIAQSALGSFLG